MEFHKKMILTAVLLSYFLTALNVSIVLTGLNPIVDELGLSETELGWVQNGYTLAFGGLILLGGKLGDVYGRRPVMTGALLCSGLGSLLAGMAWDSISLISARVIQGAGAAVLAPTSLALLMDTFKGDELVKAVAWYSSVSGLGASAGLVLGGILADFFSWRAGFALTVPVAAFMMWISIRYISERSTMKGRFDILGTVFSVTGIFALVYAMNGTSRPLLWSIVAVLLLSAFIWIEYRAGNPVMPLSLFRNSIRCNAYAARFLFLAAMFGFWFYISVYAQRVMGLSPLLTGLVFLPMTIPQFAAAMWTPGLIQSLGDKKVILMSSVLNLSGFFGMIWVQANSSFFQMILPLVLLGLGQGLALSPLTNYGIYKTNPDDRGAASGLVNVSHQIGGSVGLSLMIMVSGNEPAMISFHNGMMIGFICILGMTVLVMRLPARIS